MNSNTSGGLLVAILALAGFAWGVPAAIWSCVAVCVAAFLAEELRTAPVGFLPDYDLDAYASVLAAVSWIGVCFAILALIV